MDKATKATPAMMRVASTPFPDTAAAAAVVGTDAVKP
jgi:hypothetical protein